MDAALRFRCGSRCPTFLVRYFAREGSGTSALLVHSRGWRFAFSLCAGQFLDQLHAYPAIACLGKPAARPAATEVGLGVGMEFAGRKVVLVRESGELPVVQDQLQSAIA